MLRRVNRLHLRSLLWHMAAKSSNLTALLTMAPSTFSSGDLSALPRINSLSALKAEVQTWGEQSFGRISKQEVDDVAAWLNSNFLRLEE
jgi:hypothetical protein